MILHQHHRVQRGQGFSFYFVVKQNNMGEVEHLSWDWCYIATRFFYYYYHFRFDIIIAWWDPPPPPEDRRSVTTAVWCIDGLAAWTHFPFAILNPQSDLLYPRRRHLGPYYSPSFLFFFFLPSQRKRRDHRENKRGTDEHHWVKWKWKRSWESNHDFVKPTLFSKKKRNKHTRSHTQNWNRKKNNK